MFVYNALTQPEMIVHELGHLIGLWHEQSRFDRDAHVNVLLNNVREEHHYNYNKLNNMRLMAPYDLSSIMHYGLKVCVNVNITDFGVKYRACSN